MDELKKYLQHNREQMDVDMPPAELLQRIQKKPAVKANSRLYPMLVPVCVAACIVTVIFLSARYLLLSNDKKQGTVSVITRPAETKRSPVTNIDDTLQQLAKIESHATGAQQKNTETKKQVPAAYQLLNSFEQNYNKLVSLQLKSIRNTPVFGETPDYFNGFKTSMRRIEADEAVLKLQIKTNGLNDELLEQLINIYQDKIKLLKNLQHEISSMNNKIRENQQPADSTRIFYINI